MLKKEFRLSYIQVSLSKLILFTASSAYKGTPAIHDKNKINFEAFKKVN